MARKPTGCYLLYSDDCIKTVGQWGPAERALSKAVLGGGEYPSDPSLYKCQHQAVLVGLQTSWDIDRGKQRKAFRTIGRS